MTISISATVRNAMMNAYEATIGTAPKLRLYSGNPPATLAAAATGTLLAEITLPSDWMANAVNGSIVKSGTWSVAAIAAGEAGYYRLMNSVGSTAHEQGTVAMSGGDMTINNTNIAVDQTVTVTNFTKTASNP